jgi:hypothetical protein
MVLMTSRVGVSLTKFPLYIIYSCNIVHFVITHLMFIGSEIVMNGFQEKTGYTLLHFIECMDTNCSKTFQRLIQKQRRICKREFIIFSPFSPNSMQ